MRRFLFVLVMSMCGCTTQFQEWDGKRGFELVSSGDVQSNVRYTENKKVDDERIEKFLLHGCSLLIKRSEGAEAALKEIQHSVKEEVLIAHTFVQKPVVTDVGPKGDVVISMIHVGERQNEVLVKMKVAEAFCT